MVNTFAWKVTMENLIFLIFISFIFQQQSLFYKYIIISSRTGTWCCNLVFLRRRHFASRVDLISKIEILVLDILFSQIAIRTEDAKNMRGNSAFSGRSVSSSLSMAGPVMLGTYCWTVLRTLLPASWL